jgi:UDP-N-acetylglucosamine acyltransferase
MSNIHPMAIVDPKAEIGKDVTIGPFSIIEADVTIGDGTSIASHVVLASGTTIGKNCKISSGAIIGTVPQDLKFEDEKTFVTIGDDTVIREYATVNRATSHSFYTRVGNKCMLMAYSHIAHDCQIGNHVIIANSVNMGGHVIIEDYAGIGGLTGIHQFVKIGEYCFISGMSKVPKDVPPYILAMRDPLTYAGLNKIGLKRRGFEESELKKLKKAFKIIYGENHTVKEAIQKISDTINSSPHIKHLIEFLENSDRGIIR